MIEQAAFFTVEVVHPLQGQLDVLAGGGDGEVAGSVQVGADIGNLVIAIGARQLPLQANPVRHIFGGDVVQGGVTADAQALFAGQGSHALVAVGEDFLIDQLLTVQLMQILQELAVVVALGENTQLVGVGVHVHHGVMGNAAGTQAEAAVEVVVQEVDAGNQRNLVSHVVLIQVAVADSDQQLIEIIGGLGHFLAGLFQSLLVDVHLIRHTHLGCQHNLGQAVDRAVGSGNGFSDVRILLQQSLEVGHAGVDVGRDIHQDLVLAPLKHLRVAQSSLHDDVRQLVTGDGGSQSVVEHAGVDVFPLNVDAGHFLVSLHVGNIAKILVGIEAVGTGHNLEGDRLGCQRELSFRKRGRAAHQHDQGQEQGQDSLGLHVEYLLLFLPSVSGTVRCLPLLTGRCAECETS